MNMIPQFPMKAPSEIVPFNDPRIKYPMWGSIKFDGFRLMTDGVQFLSPALKPFPNINIGMRWRECMQALNRAGLVMDAEVWSPELTFQELQSVMRSQFETIPTSVGLYVFDLIPIQEWNTEVTTPYSLRYDLVRNFKAPGTVPVVQSNISDAERAQRAFDVLINAGHEGLMLRDPRGLYKHGRYTHAESGLFKFKEFETHDAPIIAVNERMRLREGIARTTNAGGHLERVFTKDSYEPAGMVGTFTVAYQGITFDVKPGKGFTNAMLTAMWQDFMNDGSKFIGSHIEFKWMPHGTKDKPRIGSMIRFRPELDLGEDT